MSYRESSLDTHTTTLGVSDRFIPFTECGVAANEQITVDVIILIYDHPLNIGHRLSFQFPDSESLHLGEGPAMREVEYCRPVGNRRLIKGVFPENL
jgi:hypothetical protein